MKFIKQSYLEYTINKVTIGDRFYPKKLLELKNPPKQIYYRGSLDSKLFANSIAIVGSRRMTRYGASTVDKFVSVFVQSGIATISGFMYGVDTEVHSKTVEYGGRTIAVMGGGINSPYPPDNDKLYTKILQSGGAVISEYEPEASPKLWMYPQRNRIVAALATIGVLVIEAGEKSGSLLTVSYARKLGRDIFAIPGPITSSVSEGTNNLIKCGAAKIVTNPSDIISTTFCGKAETPLPEGLSEDEALILDILRREEMTIDEMVQASGLDMLSVSTSLSMLSLKSLVRDAAGKYFVV